MTKLPYDFDLYFDIKSVEELHRILLEDALDILYDQGDLEDLEKLMDAYAIPFPEGYNRVIKTDFPRVVWIDNNGGYLTYAPTHEESDKYQRMRAF